MNLKYYLRGLGIGIVVTALLMGFATRNANTMTDEEIKERAAALGMVEQKVLSDISTPAPEENAEVKPTIAPEITATPIVTAEPETTDIPVETETPEDTEAVPTATPTAAPTEAPTPAPTEAPTEKENSSESITFVIKSGETSWSISKALYEAGVVESASDFDAYLCQNGYDKTIRTGTFEISKNATYEEIAKKIAR